MNRKHKLQPEVPSNKGVKKSKISRVFINELKIGERVNNLELKIIKKFSGKSSRGIMYHKILFTDGIEFIESIQFSRNDFEKHQEGNVVSLFNFVVRKTPVDTYFIRLNSAGIYLDINSTSKICESVSEIDDVEPTRIQESLLKYPKERTLINIKGLIKVKSTDSKDDGNVKRLCVINTENLCSIDFVLYDSDMDFAHNCHYLLKNVVLNNNKQLILTKFWASEYIKLDEVKIEMKDGKIDDLTFQSDIFDPFQIWEETTTSKNFKGEIKVALLDCVILDNGSSIMCKFEDSVGVDKQIKGYQVDNFQPFAEDRNMTEICNSLLEKITSKFVIKFKFTEKLGKFYYYLLSLELAN